jgi:hypothetical protein
MIITILYILIITTSILSLGLKTIVPKILAHTKMHQKNTENIHKYLQQQNQAKSLSKNYQNIGACLKY